MWTQAFENSRRRWTARYNRNSFHFPKGPVAQLVEHRTFNAVVAGSSPARLTIILKGLIDDPFLSCPVVLPRSFQVIC